MFKDALGNTHWEIWQGIKLNGRTFQSEPLYELSRRFGDAEILDACMRLGCLPYAADLQTIAEECERIENSFV
jgi:hypothetical protein